MKKSIIIIAALILHVTGLFGQVEERFKKGDDKKEEKKIEQKSAEEVVGEDSTQEEDNIWDRLVWGGNASFSFGTATYIYVAPSVGYKLTDKLVAGVGFNYQYVKINELYNYNTRSFQNVSGDAFENQIYGPKFFVNYLILERFYVGTQYEHLNHDFQFFNNNGDLDEENLWTPVWFLEAGLRQDLGRKGFALIGLRVNLLDDIQSPYANWIYPVIGVYF